MRLAPRGLQVLVGGLVLAAVGWLFGLPEASALAGGALVLLAVSLVWVWSHRPDLAVARTALPARCAVGDPCKIHVGVQNLAARRTSAVTIIDNAGPFGRANLTFAPIDEMASVSAGYSFPTRRRGEHAIGPLRLRVTDPFGLVVWRDDDVTADLRLVIWPQSWLVEPAGSSASGHDSSRTRQAVATSSVEEELSMLREYAPGDDVRRIHWPSTARIGTAMVRQVDPPARRLTTVLIDARAGVTSTEAFERSISAAASMVRSSAERHELVRLVTAREVGRDTADLDGGVVDARGCLDQLMDRLSSLTPDPPGIDSTTHEMFDLLDSSASSNRGQLVLCTAGTLGGGLPATLRTLEQFDSIVVVHTSESGMATELPSTFSLIEWDGKRPFAQAWAERSGQHADSPLGARGLP